MSSKKRKEESSSEEKDLIHISSDSDTSPDKKKKRVEKTKKSRKETSSEEESSSVSDASDDRPCFCPVDLCECSRCVTNMHSSYKFDECKDCSCCVLAKLARRARDAKDKKERKRLQRKYEKKEKKFKKAHKKYLEEKKKEESESESESEEEDEKEESGPEKSDEVDKSPGQDKDAEEEDDEEDVQEDAPPESESEHEEESGSEDEEEDDFEVKPAAKKSKSTNGKGETKSNWISAGGKFLTKEARMKLKAEVDPTGKRPAFFKLDMKPHQVEGIKFLQETGSACLIYEMGLGKTSMMLADICNRINKARVAGDVQAASRPHLVVLPKSVKSSWSDDFAKFVDEQASGITIKIIDEKKLKPEDTDEIKAGVYNIVVIGYEKMRTEFMNLVKPLDILPKKFDFMKAKSIQLVKSAINAYPETHANKTCPLQLNDDGTASCTLGDHWLFGQRWSTLVLDEAHKIRNGAAQVFLSSCAIQADVRYFVSGTPLHNKRDDVYNAFRFIRASNLMDLDQWKRSYPDTQASHLADLSKKYLKWKKKEDVEGMQQVPMRIFQYKVPFADKREKEVYKEFEAYMGRIADQATRCRNQHMSAMSAGYVGAVHLFAAILAARQCCNAASIVSKLPDDIRDKLGDINGNRNGWAGTESTKMKALRQVIKDHVNDGDKFLVFSSMLEALTLCDEILTKELKIGTVTLTGEMKDDARAEAIKKFRTKQDVRAFLISLKTGGEGLNLKEAKRVIVLDPWWNWQAMLQAMCRAHRLDSEHEVRVTIISISGTVEEVMLMKAEEKRKMADDLYQSATMYEMFSKAGNAGGNGRQGEGRGLGELLEMVQDFRAANSRAGRSVDEEKEHEEREVRKAEIRKTVQTSRQKKKKDPVVAAPEVSAKRKSPGQEPVTTREAEDADSEPLLHIGPVMLKDFGQLERGTVLWDVKFSDPPLVPTSLLRPNNDRPVTSYYYGNDDYRSTNRERSDGNGMHASFLALFELMTKTCSQARHVLVNYGKICQEYRALQNNKRFLGHNNGPDQEAVLKAVINDAEPKIKSWGQFNYDMWQLFTAQDCVQFRQRKFVELDAGGNPKADAEKNILPALMTSMVSEAEDMLKKRVEKAKEDLKALEAARQLTPEQAKAGRRDFKKEIRKRVSDEINPRVKIMQVMRDLDKKKNDIQLEYVGQLNLSKVKVTGGQTRLRDLEKIMSGLDPMDFMIFNAAETMGASLYEQATRANPSASYHLTVRPADTHPDKDAEWDASLPIKFAADNPRFKSNLCLVSLSTLPYPETAKMFEEAVLTNRPKLASLLTSALYIDPPSKNDKRCWGHRPHRYAVYLTDDNDPSSHGTFAGVFYFLVNHSPLYDGEGDGKKNRSGVGAQVLVLGAESLRPEDDSLVKNLLTWKLAEVFDTEKVFEKGDEVVGNILQRVVYRDSEKMEVKEALEESIAIFRRNVGDVKILTRKNMLEEANAKKLDDLHFKPFVDVDRIILGGAWHERFLVKA